MQMSALHEPKTIAGLFLIGIPLLIVASLTLYSLRSCINCAESQLWLLVPTAHPVGTIMFASMAVGSWLLVFGLRSIRIPLRRTKLFFAGIGFLCTGIIFLAWSVIAYIAYLDELKDPPGCYLCPAVNLYQSLYQSSAIIGAFLSSIGTLLLTMHWKRAVLHARGYI